MFILGSPSTQIGYSIKYYKWGFEIKNFIYLRSVSDGWVFAQGGAKRCQLLGHSFHVKTTACRPVRIIVHLECIQLVQGEYLRTKKFSILNFVSMYCPKVSRLSFSQIRVSAVFLNKKNLQIEGISAFLLKKSSKKALGHLVN